MYFIIIVTYFGIQVVQHGFFVDLAQKQYHVNIVTYPPRGPITDKYNRPLAINTESTSAFILPRQIKKSHSVRTFLETHFAESVSRLDKSQSHFMFIKRRLTDDEIKLIDNAQLDDIKLLKERCRFYPVPSMGALVGVTDIDNNGQFGIEAQFNNALSGKPTYSMIEKDARSQRYYFNKEIQQSGVASKPIKLTIDSELQFLVNEQLSRIVDLFHADEGGVVILNPTNGHVEAMCQYPSFDPNNMSNVNISHTKARPITECYEFGSVIKVFMALAALDEGVVTADEEIDCKGSKEAILNGYKVNTWKANDVIPFSEVIEFSNNIGVVQVASRLGTKLYDHYKKVGFMSKTGVGYPGEQAGYITPPKKWSKRSIISLSFGYEISNTLLQLARAMSVFTNDGSIITPKLIYDEKDPQSSERLYSSDSVNSMRGILKNTVDRGTARRGKIKGYDILGKTGTANLIVDGKYDATKNIYTFCGIVERGDYKRIIITSVKNSPMRNLYSASVAVPLFERVAEKMLIHDKII